MDNPPTLTTSSIQDIGQRQTKQNKTAKTTKRKTKAQSQKLGGR
jgi:hypothetical protein